MRFFLLTWVYVQSDYVDRVVKKHQKTKKKRKINQKYLTLFKNTKTSTGIIEIFFKKAMAVVCLTAQKNIYYADAGKQKIIFRLYQ